jgi:hypothetical protein
LKHTSIADNNHNSNGGEPIASHMSTMALSQFDAQAFDHKVQQQKGNCINVATNNLLNLSLL